jgi:GNAT superfamily N-acetyltransferase
MTMSAIEVVPVTNAAGKVVAPDWLAKAEPVHRQLRPQLKNYAERLHEVFAGGGRMAVAVKDGKVLGITVYRIQEKTYSGRELYCDDLITDETQRSTGVGHALMQYMESLGRERGCDTLALDSGCQRQQAHKFYFREGLVIPSFHFTKALK